MNSIRSTHSKLTIFSYWSSSQCTCAYSTNNVNNGAGRIDRMDYLAVWCTVCPVGACQTAPSEWLRCSRCIVMIRISQ